MHKTFTLIIILASPFIFVANAKASERLCNDGSCISKQYVLVNSDEDQEEWPEEDQTPSDFLIEDGELPTDEEESVIEITDSETGQEMLVLSGKVTENEEVVRFAKNEKNKDKKDSRKNKKAPVLPSVGSNAKVLFILGANSMIGATLLMRNKGKINDQ